MESFRLSYKGRQHNFATMEEAQTFIDSLPSSAGVEFTETPKLFQLMNSPGAPLVNWREIIKAVNEEFGRADSSEYRAGLLQVFKSVMDIVEGTIAKDDLEKFRNARAQQYKGFIVQESVIDGNVCVETLHEVTGREIAAGRMEPDHSLRKLAEDGMAAPHYTRAELLQQAAAKLSPAAKESVRPGLWRRVLGAFQSR